MRVTLDNLATAVHALFEDTFRRPCHFHLAGCAACGAPTHGYPCPSCRTWNDQSGSWARGAPAVQPTSQESWCRRVEAAGGVGPWYFAELRERVSYRDDTRFRAQVDDLVRRAAQFHWPAPSDVWAAVAERRTLISLDHAAKAAAWKEAAESLYGADRVAALMSRSSGQWSWPENCEEGRQSVRAAARQVIYNDLTDATDPAIARLVSSRVETCAPDVVRAARSAGLTPNHTDGAFRAWTRPCGDGGSLEVSSYGHLDGYPDQNDWSAARISADGSSTVTVERLTLRRALSVLNRLPAPTGEDRRYGSLDEALADAGTLDREKAARARAFGIMTRGGADMLRQLPPEQASRVLARAVEHAEAMPAGDPERQRVQQIAERHWSQQQQQTTVAPPAAPAFRM